MVYLASLEVDRLYRASDDVGGWARNAEEVGFGDGGIPGLVEHQIPALAGVAGQKAIRAAVDHLELKGRHYRDTGIADQVGVHHAEVDDAR